MAKPGKIPYVDALSAINQPKYWGGGKRISWIEQGQQGYPHCHKARVTLMINGLIQEGYFVDLMHKASLLEGVPDKVSFSLIVNGARVLGLDENGPTQHLNTAGQGLPFFRQIVDHPHMHVPAEDQTPGYAEPLDRVSIEELWHLFCARANIFSAPPFNYPAADGQLELL